MDDGVFRTLVESAPMAIAIHVDGRLVYANTTGEDVLGVGPGGAVGLSVLDLVHPDHMEVVRHRMGELLAGRPLPGSAEITLVRPDGRHVQLESVSSTVQIGERTAIYVMSCDVTERAHREAHITHLATHDGLTGLPNRLLLLDRLEQTLARIGRGCAGVLVLFLDLNGFKQINDEYGHAVGDALLREVARRLREAVRAGDTIARLAGDEFVVVSELSSDDLAAGTSVDVLGQRLAQAISAPFAVDGTSLVVGVSFGGLLLSAPTSAQAALVEADRRMYAMKHAARR